MNKTELITAVAVTAGITKAQAAHAVDAIAKVITTNVADGDKVTITGFGTFEPVKRGAREGRNPNTGQPIHIEATTVPKFKAGADFKAAVADAAKAASR